MQVALFQCDISSVLCKRREILRCAQNDIILIVILSEAKNLSRALVQRNGNAIAYTMHKILY